jgi:hypothetical protein
VDWIQTVLDTEDNDVGISDEGLQVGQKGGHSFEDDAQPNRDM